MEPKLTHYLLYEPEDNGILWIMFSQPARRNHLADTAEENGIVAEVGEYIRPGDDDPGIRIIVLTLIKLLSAHCHRSWDRLPVGRGCPLAADVTGSRHWLLRVV